MQSQRNIVRRGAALAATALASTTLLACAAPSVPVAAPAPAPAPAPPPQPEVIRPAGDGLPSRIVGGYLEAYRLALPSSLPGGYNLLYHAFAPIDGDGSTKIYVTGGVSRAQLAAEYQARRAQGKPTILSIGGEGGAKAGLTTEAQRQRFLDTVIPLIDEFGFSGIDWDLEYHVPGGISVDGMVSVSRQLRARYPGFAITMAPFADAGIEATYKEVARQLHATGDLAYVGFQFYNSVSVPTADIVLKRMESWMADTGIGPQQFVIGLWHGPDVWMGHVTSPEAMMAVWTGVQAKYPDVRGVYTWGILTTDGKNGFPFGTRVAQAVSSTP